MDYPCYDLLAEGSSVLMIFLAEVRCDASQPLTSAENGLWAF